MGKINEKALNDFFKPAKQLLEFGIKHGEIPVGRMSTGGIIQLEKEVVYYEFFIKKTGRKTLNDA